MIDIIPAILPASLQEVREKLEAVHTFAHYVQIDLVDGVYAPNTTWPFAGGEAWPTEPLKTSAILQFDLMLEHPEDQVRQCVRAGAMQIIVHAKSVGAQAALSLIAELRKEKDLSVGVALMPGALSEELRAFDGLYDFVQVMGIEHIGFQGHMFDRRCVDTVAALRAAYPELIIQVDGGVALGNAMKLAHAGANRLVAGSAIFTAPNPQQAYAELHIEANRAA